MMPEWTKVPTIEYPLVNVDEVVNPQNEPTQPIPEQVLINRVPSSFTVEVEQIPVVGNPVSGNAQSMDRRFELLYMLYLKYYKIYNILTVISIGIWGILYIINNDYNEYLKLDTKCTTDNKFILQLDGYYIVAYFDNCIKIYGGFLYIVCCIIVFINIVFLQLIFGAFIQWLIFKNKSYIIYMIVIILFLMLIINNIMTEKDIPTMCYKPNHEKLDDTYYIIKNYTKVC